MFHPLTSQRLPFCIHVYFYLIRKVIYSHLGTDKKQVPAISFPLRDKGWQCSALTHFPKACILGKGTQGKTQWVGEVDAAYGIIPTCSH